MKKSPKRQVPESTYRHVLSVNLTQLMAVTPHLDSSPKLEARCKVRLATINRVKREEVAATIDTIHAIAKAFKLEPWQLLVPNLKPSDPPRLAISDEQQEAFEKLQEAAARIAAMSGGKQP